MSEVCPTAEYWCLTSEDTIKTSFQWTIEKFSERPEKVGESLESLTFSAKEDPKNIWFLCINPKGGKEENKEFIGLFLYMKASDEDVKTEFTLTLIDGNHHLFGKRRSTYKFSKAKENWGFPSFLSRTKLEDPDNNLLPNDCLTIYCEVTTSGKTKSISGRKIEVNRMGRTLSDDITALFENQNNTDIEIEVKGHKFCAHKLILIARSPVFAAMFEHHMKESIQNRVIINDIEKEVFNNVLRFIYTDKVVKGDVESNKKLLSAADKYNLVELKSICEEFLISQLSAETVSEVLILSDTHSAENLKTYAIDFIQRNESKVMKTKGWKNVIDRPDLLQLI